MEHCCIIVECFFYYRGYNHDSVQFSRLVPYNFEKVKLWRNCWEVFADLLSCLPSYRVHLSKYNVHVYLSKKQNNSFQEIYLNIKGRYLQLIDQHITRQYLVLRTHEKITIFPIKEKSFIKFSKQAAVATSACFQLFQIICLFPSLQLTNSMPELLFLASWCKGFSWLLLVYRLWWG